jgi:hypothetical protein
MPMPAAMAQNLGNLIDALNPYTGINRAGYNPTGEMDIYAGNPAPTIPPTGTIGQVEIEVDTRYPGEWSFKGQPQKINKAVRIRYRFPVLDSQGNPLYWIDDYLLIGYEGANGG